MRSIIALNRSLSRRFGAVLGGDNSTSPFRTVSHAAADGARDWKCSCGFTNYQFRSQCLQCQSQRNQGRVDGWSMSTRAEQAFKQGDWQCTCGTHNFARRAECMTCMALRPTPRSDRPRGDRREATGRFMAGDWLCSGCNGHNFRSRESCFACGMSRAPTTAGAASWVCSSCHASNSVSSTSCCICGTAARSAESPPPQSPSEGVHGTRGHNDWDCPSCGYSNFESRLKCKKCGTAKGRGSSDSLEFAGTDKWCCDCGYLNFADREQCRDCRRPKPAEEDRGAVC